MDVNRSRIEHMLGGPISEHVSKSFNRLQNQAMMANAESHPSGWVLALCNEISYLSGRIAELEKSDESDLEHIHTGEFINVDVKGQMFRAQFLGLTPKGHLRVQLDGEERVRVVRPDKVTKDE